MTTTAWKNLDTDEGRGDDSYDDKIGGPCCPTYSKQDENHSRGNWPYGIQGSLAILGGILGSSLIMNSVPYCIRLYGLNFLAPYTVALFLLSIPLFYLEIITGQFSSRGLLSCWMVPAFKGVGVFILLVNIPHSVLQGTNAARGLYELHQGVKASLGYNITGEPMADEGTFNGTLAVALLIVWIIVAMISCFGIKAIAWLSTLLVPVYVILMIILAAMINHLIGTDEMWSRWQSANAAYNHPDTYASEVIFAALTAGLVTTGIVITYGSYNRFHNDVIKDTLFVFILKYFVDILLAVIFIGLTTYDVDRKYIRTEKIIAVKEYDWSYNVLADVFEKMSSGPSYAIAYFMMFFFMTLLHIIALLETFITSILDVLPRIFWLRPALVIEISIVLYLFSFTICSTDGAYWEMLLWRNVIMWAVHLVILLMIGCFLVYGIQTYFRHRHDVAAMTRWNIWCIPSVVPWWGATAMLLTLIPLIALGSVGQIARAYFEADRPSWSSRDFERSLSALYILVLVVTFIIQLLLAVIWKIPTDWRTMLGAAPSWMPALGKHWARVELYRDTNAYSTNNYSQMAPPAHELPTIVAPQKQPPKSFYV
ncbi:hypothetical protein LSH36_3g32039 [Paralvinella palmiformis]|uniref:Uncharacterized protein n=1 Tax=Paralvinella palmiformis TaxID=53620 RepID=A0AAD9KFW6_9ANNE|nr:hypothetical protein LSH36_3g32039 [Paralvinella palmiformis]